MDKIRVAGYCRVSTNKQAEKGHSIDDQKQRILSYCMLHNYELAEFIIDDGVTGSNLNRAGIERIKSLKDSKSIPKLSQRGSVRYQLMLTVPST